MIHWLLFGVSLLPWMRAGSRWPSVVVKEIGQHPDFAWDFVTVYMSEARVVLEGEVIERWLYPPFLAILLHPLTLLDGRVVVIGWTALNLGLAVALAALCRREIRASGPLASAAAAFALVTMSMPVAAAVKWGQPSLLIAVGVFVGLSSPSQSLGGWLLGALAGVKVYPAMYLAGPAAGRRWGVVVHGAVSACVFSFIVAIPFLGIDGTLRFFSALFPRLVEKVELASPLGGQSLWAVLDRWFVDGRHVMIDSPEDPPVPLLTSVALPHVRLVLWIAIASLIAWVTFRRLRSCGADRSYRAALTMAAVTPFVAPGWPHYFAFLPLGTAVVLGRAAPLSRPGAMALLAWALCAAPLLLLTDAPGSDYYFSQAGATGMSALLTWAALVLVDGGGVVRIDLRLPADDRNIRIGDEP